MDSTTGWDFRIKEHRDKVERYVDGDPAKGAGGKRGKNAISFRCPKITFNATISPGIPAGERRPGGCLDGTGKIVGLRTDGRGGKGDEPDEKIEMKTLAKISPQIEKAGGRCFQNAAVPNSALTSSSSSSSNDLGQYSRVQSRHTATQYEEECKSDRTCTPLTPWGIF